MGYTLARYLPSSERNCKEFYLDDGINDLPDIKRHTDIARGSTAIDIITGDTYYLNSDWEWELVYEEVSSGGSSSGSGGDSGDSGTDPETSTAQYPTLVDPSATYEFTEISSDTFVANIGETTAIEIKATFDRGLISPAYGTSGYRSGSPNNYQYTLNSVSVSSANSDTEDTTVYNYNPGSETTVGLSCLISYDVGDQPLDSNGNNYGAALSSGTLVLNGLKVQSVYPIMAGLSTDSSLAICPMTSKSTANERYVTFAAEPDEDTNQTFAVPTTKTLVGIKMIGLGGEWDWVTGTAATSLTTFEESTGTQTLVINGQTTVVNYKIYTNAYSKNGARTIMLVLE